jgi:hypothetical protein
MYIMVACPIINANKSMGSAMAETIGVFIARESSVLVSMPSNHS